MKKTLLTLAACLYAIVGFGFGAQAAAQDTVQLNAALSGANEVDDTGDPDGTGSASITVDAAGAEVCFEITASGIDAIAAGHIHSGGAGTNGPVVIDFALSDTNTSGCVTADAATIASVLNTPSLFYVNVHTAMHPDGAIRGQLAGAPGAAPTAAPTAAPAAEPTAEATDDAADDEAEAATTSTEGEELAFTGDMTGMLAVAGSALVVLGAGFVAAARRR